MQTKLSSILVWFGLTLLLATSFALSEAATHQSPSLSFADRVAYQRAIEDVYWRHRIWPRSDPKPSLDAVMSPAQLEQRVTEYLRNSQTLENCQRPITPDQLQAEMDRMAEQTKQPEVLRELFAALGDDPFVIAECVARPVLTERLQFSMTQVGKETSESQGVTRQEQIPKIVAAATPHYALPTISNQPGECIDNWTATSTTNAPSARSDHKAVWTGTEMIVWGGGADLLVNTGGRYNPSTDSWRATSRFNAPAARQLFTAVWTGTEMIVWGGSGAGGRLNTGGRYNPNTDSWTPTTTTNAPAVRYIPSAVWTGSEMIVWGGQNDDDGELNSGGRYNPNTDSWTATSTAAAPTARASHTAVWTGSEMIVWGGLGDNNQYLNTGGRYNPGSDSWTATSTTNAPAARIRHTAVQIGSEMIVWGGADANDVLDTGGRYNLTTGSWAATSTANAPTQRTYHTVVSTGSEMIVWGGEPGTIEGLNTGGRYNPSTDSWTATSTTNAPSARFFHSAIWTGSEMVVWGGFGPPNFNTGGGYCAQAATSNVKGSGFINGQGDQATFSVRATLTGNQVRGSFSFSDPAAGLTITNASIRRLTINGNSANFNGRADLDGGNRVTFNVSVADNGPGTSDTLSITVSNGYSAGGTLIDGNIRIY